jgi:hypothetical protein
MGMHSHTKEQREVVRELLRSVLVADMGMFSPERFKDWIRQMDFRFGKVGLKLTFTINGSRTVHFYVKETRTKRIAFQFAASTRVRFEERDAIIPVVA